MIERFGMLKLKNDEWQALPLAVFFSETYRGNKSPRKIISEREGLSMKIYCKRAFRFRNPKATFNLRIGQKLNQAPFSESFFDSKPLSQIIEAPEWIRQDPTFNDAVACGDLIVIEEKGKEGQARPALRGVARKPAAARHRSKATAA